MVGGFVGKKLEVDLTAKTKKTTPVTDDEIKTWVGGLGLANKMLWDRVKQGIDPLSVDNVIIISTGVLSGLPPLGSVVHSVTKSPLTGLYGEGTSNGYFGSELKNAGYDYIIFTGKADKPSYLYIKDDVVEIRDAADLWGKGCGETAAILDAKLHGESMGRRDHFCHLVIGPAGENKVVFANVMQGAYHSNSAGGTGAVWGSKNLKAISVRGTKPIPIANKAEYFRITDEIDAFARTKIPRDIYLQRRWAALSALNNFYRGTGAWKNEMEMDAPEWDQKTHISRSGSKLYAELPHNAWSDGCRNCYLGCGANSMHKWVIRSGKYAGTFGQGKSDNLDSLGPAQTYTNNMDGRIYLTCLVDELGMGAQDPGAMLAWAMEAYEKGLIKKEDLGGIEMKWGDVDASAKLLVKMVYKDGAGPTKLAEGGLKGIKKNFPGAEKVLMVPWNIGMGGGPHKSFRPKVRTAEYTCSSSHSGRGFGNPWNECMGNCSSARRLCPKGDLTQAALWKAATGFDLYQTTADIAKVNLKQKVLERCFAIREGKVPLSDERLPDRIMSDIEPVTYGHGLEAQKRGEYVTSKEFPELIQKLYKDLECDAKGYPKRESLQNLGLDFVIPVFEAMKVWG